MVAKRIANNGADVPYTASEAGFLRSAITLGAYLYQSASAIVSGIHCFPTNPTAGATDMQASVTVKCLFNIPCLLSRDGSPAILANNHFGTTAFDASMGIKWKPTANAYWLFTDNHFCFFRCPFDKRKVALIVVVGILSTFFSRFYTSKIVALGFQYPKIGYTETGRKDLMNERAVLLGKLVRAVRVEP
jgi:hypothetical protein